jgi:hypothetical protein
MATSNNPLAPDPVTDIDGPDVFPPIEPPIPEDLGEGVPLGEDPEERERPETIRDRW